REGRPGAPALGVHVLPEVHRDTHRRTGKCGVPNDMPQPSVTKEVEAGLCRRCLRLALTLVRGRSERGGVVGCRRGRNLASGFSIGGKRHYASLPKMATVDRST